MSQNTIVDLKNIVVDFDGEQVLKGINLSIKDKEFVTLLGPSGCGKTTTLRVIAGFIKPNSGDVFFGDRKINNFPPYKREVNTVFQRYALFPHLNVYENIAFGLRLKKGPQKMSDREINQRVLEMLKLVNLDGFGKRRVDQMSGGQQQRVAIARALVNHPKVLLLDEPLGALDLKLRQEMQTELKRIQKSLEITFVYVTHDQEEALTMSDTVVVMKDGVIQQIGTPQDIYNEPVNSFVADFIGESNIIGGIMREDFVVEIEGEEFDCVDRGFSKNEEVEVVIRPEDLIISPADKGFIAGTVESVTFKGVHYEIIVNVDGFRWKVHTIKNQQVGEHVGLVVSADDIHVMKKGQGGMESV